MTRSGQNLRGVVFLIALSFASNTVLLAASYGGGAGTQEDPYRISSPEHMNTIGLNANDLDKHFILTNDIDMSQYTGEQYNVIVNFTGSFDGNNHTISNFSYSTSGNYAALFGRVYGDDAEIKNLSLINPNINAPSGFMVAAIIGDLSSGTIFGCYVQGGSVTGSEYVGGLIGEASGAKILNCHSSASVTGDYYVGGLVGDMSGIVKYSSSSAAVICNDTNGYRTGGLLGNNGGVVIGSFSTGTVSNAGLSTGGLVGANFGTIAECYSHASATGGNSTGGLIGYNSKTIVNCYSTGFSSSGGLVGSESGNTVNIISNSFWDINTSGTSSSEGGVGLTTSQMQDQTSLKNTGWDFIGSSDGPSDVWAIPDGGGYPVLWWQLDPVSALPIFSGGTGTEQDPCLIADADDLAMIGHNHRLMDLCFNLTRDIDMSGYDFESIGILGVPFTGVFDGDGFAISNLHISTDNDLSTGLFGYIYGDNTEIKNIGLVNPAINVNNSSHVGALIGHVHVEFGEAAVVSSCYVEGGSVNGNDYVGGLIGLNGITYRGCTIIDCYSNTSVTAHDYAGGLAAQNSGSITACYSKGSVSGNNYIGGMVGIRNGLIAESYSTASVSGVSNVGGFSGNDSTFVSCFWDTETSGQATSPGAGILGLTTIEMQLQSTFENAGWDFVGASSGPSDVWAIPDGGGYPILWWQLEPVPALPTFAGGSGTELDPYLIADAEDLSSIGHNHRLMNSSYKLVNDIDMSGENYYIIGDSVVPFAGSFDGDGKIIFNLTIDSNDIDCIGMFGKIYSKASIIEKIGMINPNIDANSGNSVGTLVGALGFGRVRQCYSKGGSVSGNTNVGGLVGNNMGYIHNSYSTTNVSGEDKVGGLIGHCYYSAYNSFSTGSVEANTLQVGGFVGSSYGGRHDCFWDTETSGQLTSGGTWEGGAETGLVTILMQDPNTFITAGWDFFNENTNGTEDIWRLCDDGMRYPRLNWEFPSGDYLCPDGVGVEDLGYLLDHWLTVPSIADINTNGIVDIDDAMVVCNNWLDSSCGDCNGADIIDDDVVNFSDLAEISRHWQEVDSGRADLNNDGDITLSDFGIFALYWLEGTTP